MGEIDLALLGGQAVVFGVLLHGLLGRMHGVLVGDDFLQVVEAQVTVVEDALGLRGHGFDLTDDVGGFDLLHLFVVDEVFAHVVLTIGDVGEHLLEDGVLARFGICTRFQHVADGVLH